ncbi:protein of unknown function [Streptantibioticus cattleyicolor NRRL 8057 = DSM 46488]|nr:protein of unknown function [Streptantibioticus cattleyicolor NRRL 8057 = DSM 46488]
MAAGLEAAETGYGVLLAVDSSISRYSLVTRDVAWVRRLAFSGISAEALAELPLPAEKFTVLRGWPGEWAAGGEGLWGISRPAQGNCG